MNSNVEALFNLSGVNHHLSAPYHPMMNGLVDMTEPHHRGLYKEGYGK